MVFGVCRRVLGAVHDAEDAFQSAFLILAIKGTSIRQRQTVGNWLYGVAYRTALHAQRLRARRSAREKQMENMPESSGVTQDADDDVLALLDRELNRLPDKYRLPIVLCDLEGRSRAEVVRQLGIPAGTLSNRLTAGRRMLARRLARHGVLVAAGAVTTLLERQASATVPVALVSPIVKAAALIAARQASQAAVSAQVLTLTRGVLQSMLLSKLKTVLTVAAALILLGVGGMKLVPEGASAQRNDAIEAPALIAQLATAAQPPVQPGANQGTAKPKKHEQQIADALQKLKSAKGAEAEKKAFVELQQAMADLKDALHQKWGLPKAGKKPDKEAEAPKVAADQVATAFLLNEAFADDLFANKDLVVTGTVTKIIRAPKGFESKEGVPDYLVEVLSTDKKLDHVPLQFLFAASDQKHLTSLRPTQTVTIRAFCRGLVPGVIAADGLKKGKSIHFWNSKIVATAK
jgi:RNA polymerase sigma factor (sigma-70 family)